MEPTFLPYHIGINPVYCACVIWVCLCMRAQFQNHIQFGIFFILKREEENIYFLFSVDWLYHLTAFGIGSSSVILDATLDHNCTEDEH